MSFLVIDGAQGEGGGQVLRTALTLSILTKKPIEITNIRARRKKPGLLRQHLTSVLAATAISGATTEGVDIGSNWIRFSPGEVTPGDYAFSIGTAGSTVLVCQTILPVLAMANATSNVKFEGGTHNGMSPSLCFLAKSYLPILERMGITCQIKQTRLGFYPAGGGQWQINIRPNKNIKPIELLEPGHLSAQKIEKCALKALVSQIPKTIGEREIKTARRVLGWVDSEGSVTQTNAVGSGNSFQLQISNDSHLSLFEVFGELGVSAERVAKRCAGRVRKYIEAEVAVEEYLADQLLIPMALAKKGSFTTTKPSLHTITNIDVIKQFLDLDINLLQLTEHAWRISILEK